MAPPRQASRCAWQEKGARGVHGWQPWLVSPGGLEPPTTGEGSLLDGGDGVGQQAASSPAVGLRHEWGRAGRQEDSCPGWVLAHPGKG